MLHPRGTSEPRRIGGHHPQYPALDRDRAQRQAHRHFGKCFGQNEAGNDQIFEMSVLPDLIASLEKQLSEADSEAKATRVEFLKWHKDS